MGLEAGGVSLVKAPLKLQWNGTSAAIGRIDEYTFVVQSPALASVLSEAGHAVHNGKLVGSDGTAIEFQFRVRSADGEKVLCSFFDLPISKREQILELTASQSRPQSRDALQTLSYDQLATGNTVHGEVAPRLAAGQIKKTLAVGMLAASMIVMLGWVVWMVRSQSAVSVANAVMMGNYIPVNAPMEGKLMTLRVAIGDRIAPGQLIATIGNPGYEYDLGIAKSKLDRARRDLDAQLGQATDVQQMLKIAEMTIDTRQRVAVAAKARIDAELRIANGKVARLEYLVPRKNIRMTEYEDAVAVRDRLVAELQGQEATLAGVATAKEAIKQNVIVYDDRVVNPLSEVEARIAAARAVVLELEDAVALFEGRIKASELTAQTAGTVFAIYRQAGEVVKIAEEVLAINQDGTGWASGHVPAERAASIRPGLLVDIEIPSYGVAASGIVEAIGHRAVHGRGGYNADFRGKPLDVPIRVVLNESVSHPLPSGLRINMTVRVRDYVKELRDWLTRVADRSTSRSALSDPPPASPI